MKGLTKQNDYISFGDFILENEKIILSSNRMNGLFIIDQQDKQKMKIERFLGVPEEEQYYHRQICRWKDNLYFVSNGSDIVNVYNLKTEKQTVIEIGMLFRCIYAFIKDERLFMIPLYGTDEMISIGLIKNDVRKEHWWNLSQYHMEQCVLRCGHIDQNRIWMFSEESKYLFIVDFVKQKIEKYTLEEENKICGVDFDGESFWIVLMDDIRILKWNVENNEVTQYCFDEIRAFSREQYFYMKVIAREGKVFLVSADCSRIFLLDEKSNSFSQFLLFPDYMKKASVKWYIDYQIVEKNLVLCPGFTNMVIVIDLDTLETNFYDTTIIGNPTFDHYIGENFEKIMLRGTPIMECDTAVNLKNYISFMEERGRKSEKNTVEKQIGEKIYKAMALNEVN